MSDTYGNLREQMVAATSSTGVKVSDLVAKPKLEQTMTVEAARDIWIAAVKCAESYSTPKGGAEYLKETLEFLRKELGQDESVLLGAFLSSGELSVKGKDDSGETNHGQNKIATGCIKGLEINKEAGEVILTGELARRTLFHVVEEKRAEAAHAISKTIALFNVYWTGKGNEERSRAAEKVEEVKRLLNDLVSLADLARELRSSAQFGGTCDEAKEGCPHCPEASQSSQKPRDLQKDTDQGLTDRRS